MKGAARGPENEANLLGFLADPVVRILEVGDATSRSYAILKHFLNHAGTPNPENDVWISAIAVEHLTSLVTSDAHFDCLPQVARVME